MSKIVEVGSLKTGSWITIDGEPCQIVEIAHSKPGKHGSAKARIVAIGLFDGVKRTIVSPTSDKIEVPIIEKRTGQVIAMLPSSIQLMDLETYETFETDMPEDEELKKKVIQGATVEYWRVYGRTKIMRVRSE
ncbi:translation initiation factor IF-5A [Candidatus Bathyarchaeota archaeon ex4484_205]|nr:MAG: translation initiation factor IF-5A [Candidatus Bathyarchaeota archaeon ex4484_205]